MLSEPERQLCVDAIRQYGTLSKAYLALRADTQKLVAHRSELLAEVERLRGVVPVEKQP